MQLQKKNLENLENLRHFFLLTWKLTGLDATSNTARQDSQSASLTIKRESAHTMASKMDLQIAKPLTLPSGLALSNRLVNAAMTEQMADPRTFLPTPAMNAAYAAWADGGWGMVLTGNVQVDLKYLGGPSDTALSEPEDEAALLESWKSWAKACKTRALAGEDGTPTVMQVNHPGRQTPVGAGTRGIFAKSLAPSPVPLKLGDGILAKMASALVFGTPREMTVADIEDVVHRFAYCARLAAEAGFDGVEIHAAHGYLLAQFLSAKTNLRTDAYGGSPTRRAKIVVDIAKAMRDATPKGFTVGIKLNSVDHQSETDLKDCIEQLDVINAAGVDFLEISGGTYEDPSVSAEPCSLVPWSMMMVEATVACLIRPALCLHVSLTRVSR